LLRGMTVKVKIKFITVQDGSERFAAEAAASSIIQFGDFDWLVNWAALQAEAVDGGAHRLVVLENRVAKK